MRRIAIPLFVGLVAAVSACGDQQGAWGDVNSIIAATSSDFWSEIEGDVFTALEPRVFTTRDEKAFRLTYQDPNDEDWLRLKVFKQMLVIGHREDHWVAEALAELDEDQTIAPPQILQAHDVWARGQLVTILLLPEEGGREELVNLLEPLHELLDRQYRDWAVNKMFMTGRDTALADTLRRDARFNLVLPRVYYWARKDSVFMFRNDNPDPSELIREVMVTWRTPIPDDLQPEDILAWRAEVTAEYYSYPQTANLENVQANPGVIKGNDAYQIQAIWENEPDSGWPAAGPFITQAIVCRDQNRMYLVDAWLYAPGVDKYEYMIQLETILNSFDCNNL